VDPATLREYVEGYDRREAERLAARRAAAERARALVPALAAACRRRGASRVRLFGSLVTGRHGATPDVDLAAEGLPPDQFFDLLAELTRLASPFDVDLVETERAAPSLLARIEADGVDA
jgi:predicted nucleotidyltransferase